MIPEEAFEKMWHNKDASDKARIIAKALGVDDVTGFVENFKAGHKQTWLQACEYMDNGS